MTNDPASPFGCSDSFDFEAFCKASSAIEPPLVALQHPVLCVVGPTASGKTALAQALAEELRGEVISADSMQIYRGMDIGTGKIYPQDRTVPYHGLDICDPGEPYSAALFQGYARSIFAQVDKKGSRSVLCGGTGLYVKAAIDCFDFPKGEQCENPVRNHYTQVLDTLGNLGLWNLLHEQDPASAEIIHPNNTRRVIRAFELLDQGKSYAKVHAQLAHIPLALPAFQIGLQVDPAILNARIDARVDAMVEEGLIDEVKALLNQGFREGICAPQAIGYKEIVAALEGEITLDQAIEQIKIASHRYAKRQRTWFKKDKRIYWISADSPNVEQMLSQIDKRLLQ